MTLNYNTGELDLEPAQPPQQEPVAWWNGEYATSVFALKRDTPGIGLRNPNAVPLYTAPQPAQPKLVPQGNELARSADLVAAHEREQCALACETVDTSGSVNLMLMRERCADAVRERGNKQ